MSRISGPLLDRIDLHIEVGALNQQELVGEAAGEPSAAIRERVLAARARQRARFQRHHDVFANAHISARDIPSLLPHRHSREGLLRSAILKLGLSARAYHRVLRVAHTIAGHFGSVHSANVQIPGEDERVIVEVCLYGAAECHGDAGQLRQPGFDGGDAVESTKGEMCGSHKKRPSVEHELSKERRARRLSGRRKRLKGEELPYFAALHLFKTPGGEAVLRKYFRTYAAPDLDAGDPSELGQEYAHLRKQQLKHLNVMGGCCGTDHRHVEQIASACLPLFREAT